MESIHITPALLRKISYLADGSNAALGGDPKNKPRLYGMCAALELGLSRYLKYCRVGIHYSGWTVDHSNVSLVDLDFCHLEQTAYYACWGLYLVWFKLESETFEAAATQFDHCKTVYYGMRDMVWSPEPDHHCSSLYTLREKDASLVAVDKEGCYAT